MKILSKQNKAILREMVSTDFKVRYQGSALGYLWSLLKPLFMFAILYAVFTIVFPVGKQIENFGAYLLLGIVLWNFFTEATTVGASSVVAHGDLLRKISIPRYLVVISSSVSALINLGLSMIIVFFIAFVFAGIVPSLSWIFIAPLIIELYAFALACSFILAAAYVRFRDVSYIWEILLQAGFYASAVIFPLQLVAEQYQKWFFLNPLVQIIQDMRYIIATDMTITIWKVVTFPYILIPFVIIVFVAIFAFRYFKKQAHTFAENV